MSVDDMDMDLLPPVGSVVGDEVKPKIGRPKKGEFTFYRIGLDQPLADEFELFMREEGITTVTEAFRAIMRGWAKGQREKRKGEGG